jgi:hypothetical protein
LVPVFVAVIIRKDEKDEIKGMNKKDALFGCSRWK